MRSYDATDEDDVAELAKIKAEPWMVELLELNPDYVHWGPHEDYMCDKNAGWAAPLFYDGWNDVNIGLDDLNEVVNFYFQLERECTECTACDHSGYNPATKRISDTFYDFEGTGERWSDKITQDELEALFARHRLCDYNRETQAWEPMKVTLEQVNRANSRYGRGGEKYSFSMSHDGINRYILIETRAKRLGVYGHCPTCKGDGYTYTKPAAQVNLVLWLLHPRKGCSRGVEVKNIQQADLPKVFAFLKQSDDRNRARFQHVRLMAQMTKKGE